jgi:L-arabinokinase
VLVAYISGHGFGHFVRASAVLSLIRGVKTHLRTNGRAFFLASRADWASSITEVDVGPGVIQRGPLASDLAATRRALEQHLHDWPRLVAEEAAFLRESGARLVFGDVPPLAFAAAAEAGVPSVALANFSWSWIYDGYSDSDPWFAQAAARMREAEARATLLLGLDMGGGLDSFPRQQRIAPVARPLTRSPESVRAALGLKKARTFVLFSLGGFGDDFEVELAGAERHQVVATSVKLPRPPPGVMLVEPSDDLPHHELVAAADCLIGKPGYGTVAECLRRPTPLCWLPRSEFREWAPLSASIQRWLPNHPMSLDDLRSGRWAEVVDRALASQPRERPPAPDGAAEAASVLQGMLA